jgi:citrate lyase subunit beta/citryl-CoA lyase
MDVRLRRSVLYMPAANERAMAKAKTLAADALIFDLEDAVVPDAKPQARQAACEAVQSGAYGGRELIIRANAMTTPWGKDDLAAIAEAGPDAVLVPKIETREDVRAVAQVLDQTSAPLTLKIWAMMETPLAIVNARGIAALGVCDGSRLDAWVMGTNDLAKDIGCALEPASPPLVDALSACVLAARAYGLTVLDGVYNDIRNEAGFAKSCGVARAMGFDGKTLIHPNQIAVCNKAFSPSEEELTWARAVIEGFAKPENARAGAIMVEGRMAERLHLDLAEKAVAAAGAAEERA